MNLLCAHPVHTMQIDSLGYSTSPAHAHRFNRCQPAAGACGDTHSTCHDSCAGLVITWACGVIACNAPLLCAFWHVGTSRLRCQRLHMQAHGGAQMQGTDVFQYSVPQQGALQLCGTNGHDSRSRHEDHRLSHPCMCTTKGQGLLMLSCFSCRDCSAAVCLVLAGGTW